MLEAYELLGFEKVNDVDEEKARKIAESIKKNGWKGAPILTYGNCLVTGSHRLTAFEILYDEDFSLDFECAYDISDILEEKGISEEELWESTDNLSTIFEGTWVEEYADEIEEW